MLTKQPKPFYRKVLIRGATIIFVAEAVAFAGCYYIWNKLNSDRDFRFTVRQKYPYILDSYYKLGETLGNSKIRQLDQEYWEADSKLN